LFHNPGTCANYVGHVRWACVNERVSLHWDTPSLRQAIKGVKNTHVDYYGGPSCAKSLLTEKSLAQLVIYYSGQCDAQFIVRLSTNWEFLLRVQSEGLEVHKGDKSWSETMLDGINAAMWVSDKGEL